MITLTNFYFLFFILCGLPILTYPMILLANLMSLGGHRSKSTSQATIIMMKVFIFSTTFYPITYFFALYKYRNTTPETHHLWVGMILLHLFFIFLAFKGWGMAEKKRPRRTIK